MSSFLTELMGHIPSTQRDYPQIEDKAKNNTEDILFVVPDCFKINLNGITQSKNILSETFRINSKADSTTFFVPLVSPDNTIKVGQM